MVPKPDVQAPFGQCKIIGCHEGHPVQRAIDNGQFTKRRGTKGRDVMAACGQLGNPEIRARRRVDGTPLTINASTTESTS